MNMKKFLSLCLAAMMVLAVGCSANNGGNAENGGEAKFTAGTYEVTGEGYSTETPIKLSVTFTDTALESIKVVESGETEGIGGAAMETLISQVVEGQTLAVDAVAGATMTTNGFTAAVASAFEAAGADPAEYGYVPGEVEILPACLLLEEVEGEEEGYRYFEYTTDGRTCSDRITFSINEKEMTVHNMVVYNGCDGTSKGFCILSEEMPVDYCVERMEGILCHGSNGSSCPDQCAKALKQAKSYILGEECTACDGQCDGGVKPKANNSTF